MSGTSNKRWEVGGYPQTHNVHNKHLITPGLCITAQDSCMDATTNQLLGTLLTSEDLLATGHSYQRIRKLCVQGELYKIRQGVFIPATTWHGLMPWDQQLARVLAWSKVDPDAVFSHTSAAQLLGLAVSHTSNLVHVYATQNSRSHAQGIQKHYLLTPGTQLHSVATYLTTTAPLATVLDCARTLPLTDAVVLADSALLHRYVSLTELTENLRTAIGRNCRNMKTVADLISDKSESPGESRTRLLLKEMNLDFEEQVEFVLDGSRYRCDFVLWEYRVIVEFDGRLKLTDFGASDHVLERERYREKALQNVGWVVFRVDWDMVVRRPHDFKRQLTRLLQQRVPTF